MDAFYFLDGLKFQNQFVVNEQINSVTTVQPYAFIFDGQWMLQFKRDVSFCQLMCQALLVGGLKQTGAENSMDFDCTSDNLFG